MQAEAKDTIAGLLQHKAFEVKEHHYFAGIDWGNLLRMKVDFIPQLDNEEDTSYLTGGVSAMTTLR